MRGLVVALCSVCGGCFLSGYELAPRDGGEPLVDAATPDASPPVDTTPSAEAGATPVVPLPSKVNLDACGSDTWCLLSCGTNTSPCDFVCPPGAYCQVTCSGPNRCAGLDCTDATCDLKCDGQADGTCGANCKNLTTCEGQLEGDAWCGDCNTTPPRHATN